jgi:mannonate dehydratase
VTETNDLSRIFASSRTTSGQRDLRRNPLFRTRKKIFNVHFRKYSGIDDFIEVYPNEPDIDFVKAMHVYKEIGYPYMVIPEHVPQGPGDPAGLQSFA